MSSTVVTTRLPWQDRWTEPSLEQLLEPMKLQHRRLFEQFMSEIAEFDHIEQVIAWYGQAWNWTIQYQLVIPGQGPHTLVYLVPRIETPIICMPLSDDMIEQLPLKRLNRFVRDGIKNAKHAVAIHWATWTPNSKAEVSHLADLLKRECKILLAPVKGESREDAAGDDADTGEDDAPVSQGKRKSRSKKGQSAAEDSAADAVAEATKTASGAKNTKKTASKSADKPAAKSAGKASVKTNAKSSGKSAGARKTVAEVKSKGKSGSRSSKISHAGKAKVATAAGASSKRSAGKKTSKAAAGKSSSGKTSADKTAKAAPLRKSGKSGKAATTVKSAKAGKSAASKKKTAGVKAKASSKAASTRTSSNKTSAASRSKKSSTAGKANASSRRKR